MIGVNRIKSPERFTSRADAVASGMVCVFISHQQDDKVQAVKVVNYIRNFGIDVYFDEDDSELQRHHRNKNAKGVTKAICEGINNSSHMIAIVSQDSLNSSWVPFEVGYGYEKTELSIVCLKGIDYSHLPEYVHSAEIIRDLKDLNKLLGKISGKNLPSPDGFELDDSEYPLVNVMEKELDIHY